MMAPGGRLLVAAAVADFLAAALHLAVIAGGPRWYAFVGAGGRMVRMAAAGWLTPHLWTVAIAAVLAAWGCFALSGAGVIGRLPLLRPALVAISAVYLGRALMMFAPWPAPAGAAASFWVWSSLVTLAIGVLHAAGTWRAWPRLG